MKLSRYGSLLIFLMVAIVYSADYFNLPRLNLILILGFGMFACISGVRIVIKGQVFGGRIQISNPRYIQRYSDLSARLIGAVLAISGLMIIGLSILDVFKPGGASAFLERLTNSTYGLASVVALAGIFLTVFGVIRILSGSATSPGTRNKLIELNLRAGDILIALVGLGLLFLAIWAALDPGLLQDMLGQNVRDFQNLVSN